MGCGFGCGRGLIMPKVYSDIMILFAFLYFCTREWFFFRCADKTSLGLVQQQWYKLVQI